MYTFMEYNFVCTDIILTLKGSNHNGNQNSINYSKKQLIFNTESAAKVLIGSMFEFDPKSKHTNTEQADIFRTKARYIHLFFANGKADSTKDFNSKDKHGFKEFPIKNFDNKNECTRQSKQYKSNKKAQPTSSENSKRRDSFEFSSKDVEKSVRSGTNSKSTTNGKSTTKNNNQHSMNGQTKKTVKNNSSNKNTVSGSASKSNKSSKNKVPDGLNQHLKHTKDPKQKAEMQKTIKDIENSSSSEKADKTSKKLKELGIDLTTLTYLSDGSNYASGIFLNADKYTIVSDSDSRLKERGYMTQADYNSICYIVAHETGGTNNSTEMFATASALMNQIEQRYEGSTIKDSLDYFYKYNVGGGPSDKNSILYDAEQRSKLVDNVKDCVDLALSGVRAFPEEIQGWYASDGSHKYGTCLDRGGIVRTSGKSGYKQ